MKDDKGNLIVQLPEKHEHVVYLTLVRGRDKLEFEL